MKEAQLVRLKSVERCIICEQSKSSGIHLMTSFICKECEQEIVQSEIDESMYTYLLERLRQIELNRLL